MKDIAVLMTCHNRKNKTLSCLNRLFNQSGLNQKYRLQVYLVDDGSSDDTGEFVQAEFPVVKIIKGNGTLFWNRGMHEAWKSAEKGSYDFFLWLNDDTYLFQDTINNLLECAAITNDEAIICGNTCSEVCNNRTTYGGMDKKGNLIDPNGVLQTCDSFQGNCVLIPKVVHKKIGKLDPFFHHAIGDLDYGLRAKREKIGLFIAPAYAGTCETHETLPKWCLGSVPFKYRIKNLYSPLGNSHPFYYIPFVYRHYGLFTAIKHFVSIHLRVSMPSLWKQ